MTSREAAGQDLAPAGPIEALPAEALGSLRDALVRSGYGPELLAATESVAPGLLDAVRLPAVKWWLERRGGPAALLASVFEYAGDAPREAMADALGEGVLAALLSAGALAQDGDRVLSRVRLTPLLDGLFVLSDPPHGGADAVMGPGATTATLCRLVPGDPGAVLDVGCGAGTLALVAAARGASRAVGVDLSPRAISFARLNARLNRSTAEFRQGDLLAPVAGEAFDLALSQPPYVVRPPEVTPTVYLHAGARGDELALRFAAALPSALREGGRALLLFDAVASAEPLHARLRRALADAPADVVVLAAPGLSPDLQAIGYASLEDPSLGRRYRDALRRYRDHLDAIDAQRFTRALAVLVRSGIPGGRLDVALPVSGLSGITPAALDRYLAGLDVACAPDAELLAARIRPAPGARVCEERPAERPDAAPARSVRAGEGGLAVDRSISEAGAALLDALAVAPSVEEAIERFAGPERAGGAAARRQIVDFVREALSRALVVRE